MSQMKMILYYQIRAKWHDMASLKLRDVGISKEIHTPDIQRSFQVNLKIMESKLLNRICLRHSELDQKPLKCLMPLGSTN